MNEQQEEILVSEQDGGEARQEEPRAQGDTERIFTQRDVDHIVRQRLATEKARSAALLAQKEQELQARALGYQARDALLEKGLPVELMQVLDYTDEAAFAAALERLEEVLGQRLQQGIERRLRGGAPRAGGGGGVDVRRAFGLGEK